MGQIEPLGDYMLDPPEDPPECGECGTPHEGDTCPDCGHEVPEEDPDVRGEAQREAQQDHALSMYEWRGGDR